MKKLLILSLIIIAALGGVAKTGDFAFKWKSSSLFPNGTVVQACVGDNVTFPWVFDMTSPKQVVIQWSKTSVNKPDREKLSDLALYSSDIFHELSPERSLEFLPNAGIKLPKVTLADEGFYKVEIILLGYPESYKQVAFLHVIGLANLHHLTKTRTVKLRVDLWDFHGYTAYAIYNTFSISGADDNYRLNVGGYNGTAGDSLARHNKMQFSTFDRDHDTYNGVFSCAQSYRAAWWYYNCYDSNLNGHYKSNGVPGSDGVMWIHWRINRSLKRVEMKIKE